MNPCKSASLITALACEIFNSFSSEEVEVFAAQLVQLGDTLTTMLTQQSVCQSNRKE
ncbi:MAG: DUF6774 domain-containing protein [Lachnospiraceae bacterium]|nr:DUF6774 domain-containing protein [Lachnospiraceae bacterium]